MSGHFCRLPAACHVLHKTGSDLHLQAASFHSSASFQNFRGRRAIDAVAVTRSASIPSAGKYTVVSRIIIHFCNFYGLLPSSWLSRCFVVYPESCSCITGSFIHNLERIKPEDENEDGKPRSAHHPEHFLAGKAQAGRRKM